jgi:hypothetical protein
MSWLLVAGCVFLLVVIVFVSIVVNSAALPDVGLSKVMLNCPHCGAETPSSELECRHCRRSFREETTRVQPVIDAPKLHANATDTEPNVRDKLMTTFEIPKRS